jgi:hypothetical protein
MQLQSRNAFTEKDNKDFKAIGDALRYYDEQQQQ